MLPKFRELAKVYLTPTIFSLLTWLAGQHAINLQQELWDNEEQSVLSALSKQQASNIEQQLTNSLITTEILAHQVKNNPNISEDEFISIASKLVQSIKSISNLQLLPKGIVTYIHPLSGNEQAIGHNVLFDDMRRKRAMMAIETRSLTLAGPFKTIQGPVAVIGRRPVFIGQGNREVFWGFVSAMISIDTLLANMQFNQLTKNGIHFQLVDLEPSQTTTFAGTDLSDHKNFAEQIINLPGQQWMLRLAKHNEHHTVTIMAANAALAIMCLLIFMVNYYMIRKPLSLSKKIRRQNKQLFQLENLDKESGLGNREHLDRQLKRFFKLTSESPKGAFILINIENYRNYRTLHGQNTVNQLSKLIGERLRYVTHFDDLLAHLGEGNFVVVIADVSNLNEVWLTANRISELLRKTLHINGQTVEPINSLGISIMPEDGKTVDTLLKRASIALSEGRKNNKNPIRIFSEEMESNYIEMVELEMSLKQAVVKEQFILHYQPQYHLESNEIRSFEALVRWQEPNKGLIYPDKFIHILENTDLIQQVGHQIIKQACQAQYTFSNILGENVGMSINLSAKQFHDPNLFSFIKDCILNVGSPPSCFTFEITESLLVDDNLEHLELLNKLRSFGTNIAIDDFGTGYSSLAKLKQLPISELKIDRSFVKELPLNTTDIGITATILTLSKHLDLKVVAEGIENEAQHQFLLQRKCQLGQGYLYNRPLTLSKAAELLYTERARKVKQLSDINQRVAINE